MAGEKTVAAQRQAWLAFKDEAGQTLRPPKARTWGRRGKTPVIPVSNKAPAGPRSPGSPATGLVNSRAAMRQMIDARDWLRVIRLPAYAPDLNPTEAVWSHLKRSIGNLAVHSIDRLQAIIKNRLESIQYRTDLIDTFLAHTGLALEPETA